MGRIRTIKPEFPQSETLGKVSRDARLTFAMLFTVADDDGRMSAPPRLLASLLFPYDDDAPALIEGWLAELEHVGCVRRYSVGGSSYLDIPRWKNHQKIDHPSPSRLPEYQGCAREEPTKPREASRAPDEASRGLAPDLGRDHNHDQDQDQDLSSLRSNRASGAEPASLSEANSKIAADDAPSKREVEALADEFCAAYPKRVDRAPTKAKFAKLVKSGIDPNHLISAAARFAEACRIAGREKRFIQSPLVWLNRRKFDDEDLPQPPREGPAPRRTAYAAMRDFANGHDFDGRRDQGFAFDAAAPDGITIDGDFSARD
jgi:hypothetical protein